MRPMFGPSGVSIGQMAVMGRALVAHLEAGPPAGQAARPEADLRRLCVPSESGLVWSMNCASREDPKNSPTAAAARFALMRACGMKVSMSNRLHALLDRALHAQETKAVWFS